MKRGSDGFEKGGSWQQGLVAHAVLLEKREAGGVQWGCHADGAIAAAGHGGQEQAWRGDVMALHGKGCMGRRRTTELGIGHDHMRVGPY